MLDYRLGIFSILGKEVVSTDFKEFCRGNNKASFTRNRVLTLERLIVLIMSLSRSYQRELNNFFKLILKGEYNIRAATSGALTQARAKLNPKAFKRLQDICIDKYYEEADYKKWNGYRLLAVDGSVLNLPSSKNIIEEFGQEEHKKRESDQNSIASFTSMARSSILYDVKNQVTLDAQIGGYRVSEKMLLKEHLEYLEEGDLLLGDRGYASNAIIHWLFALKVDFCIRMVDYKMNAIKEFITSDLIDTEIEIRINSRTRKEDGFSKDLAPVKIRIVKVELDTGELEILGTSLLDSEKYDINKLKELYFLRWGVEEAYKMLKSRIELEHWSGKTAISIYQDFYAKIFMMTLCAVFSHPIEQKIRDEYNREQSGNKYDQKINRTDAMSETKDNLIPIFLQNANQKVIDIMDAIISRSRTVIRPGRKNKRIDKGKGRKSPNYKKI